MEEEEFVSFSAAERFYGFPKHTIESSFSRKDGKAIYKNKYKFRLKDSVETNVG
jgi:hypothetical protein